MLRFYLRLIVIITLLTTTAVIFIHTQPYDDQQIRNLLLPDECPSSCFMGIRPSVTRLDEATRLLNQSPWVEKINYNSPTYISWQWSGQQPRWINTAMEGSLGAYDDRVTNINVFTLLPLGDALLDIGINGRIEQRDYEPRSYTRYTVSYHQYYLLFDFMMDCGHHAPYVQPVNMIVGVASSEDYADATLASQKPSMHC
jgi:hypothetical protein